MSILASLDTLPDVVQQAHAVIPAVGAEAMTDNVDLTQGAEGSISFTFPDSITTAARLGGMAAGSIYIVPKLLSFFKDGGGVGGGGVFQKLGGKNLILVMIVVALLLDINNIVRIANFLFSIGSMGVSGITSIFGG